MLTVNQLTKSYSGLLANDNLTFTIPDGNISILAGPNGAGKSTVIKCIAGLLRFTGQITINGHPTKSRKAKKVLGYIPEIPNLYEMLTIEEHFEFIARAYALRDGWQQRADELLRRFELDDKRKKTGSELSKGMQQKVSICCALLHDPQVILFDEPLVGLDPHAIKELKELFKELREAGKSVLISTHMLDSVETFWDIVYIMMKGRIAAIRSRSDIMASGESLEKLFFDITEGGEAK